MPCPALHVHGLGKGPSLVVLACPPKCRRQVFQGQLAAVQATVGGLSVAQVFGDPEEASTPQQAQATPAAPGAAPSPHGSQAQDASIPGPSSSLAAAGGGAVPALRLSSLGPAPSAARTAGVPALEGLGPRIRVLSSKAAGPGSSMSVILGQAYQVW